MKIRQGYVSNSSTASFVVIGFDATERGYDWHELESISKKYGCSYLYGGDEGGLSQGVEQVIGCILGWFPTGSYPEPYTEDIYEILEKVTNIRNELRIDAPVLVWSGLTST